MEAAGAGTYHHVQQEEEQLNNAQQWHHNKHVHFEELIEWLA